jgi:hypothetical protein
MAAEMEANCSWERSPLATKLRRAFSITAANLRAAVHGGELRRQGREG